LIVDRDNFRCHFAFSYARQRSLVAELYLGNPHRSNCFWCWIVKPRKTANADSFADFSVYPAFRFLRRNLCTHDAQLRCRHRTIARFKTVYCTWFAVNYRAPSPWDDWR
jgi:hypothetical protein